MTNRFSFRTKKQHSHSLTKAHNHNSRIIVAHEKHINHDLSKNNESLIDTHGKTLRELIDDRIEKMDVRQIKGNAVLAQELNITCSPEYFRPSDPDRAGYYEQDKLDEWKKATMESLKKEFGDNLISAELHLDETTPHIHAMVTPILSKTLMKKQTKQQKKDGEEREFYQANRFDASIMFSRKMHRYYQEELPKAVKHLGIERGVKHSKDKHMSPSEWRAITAAKAEKITRPGQTRFIKSIKKKVGSVNLWNFKEKIEDIYKFAHEHFTQAYKPIIKKLKSDNAKLKTAFAATDIKLNQANRRIDFYDKFMAEYSDTPEEFIESFSYQIQQNKALNDKNVRLVEENNDIQKQANEAVVASSHDYQLLNQELMQTKIDHEKVERSLKKEISNLKTPPPPSLDSDSSSSFDM